MSYIQKNLRTDAVVWQRSGSDGYGGNTYTTFLVKCRWEDKQILFRDASGQELTSKAVVYVDTDVAIGSYIMQFEAGYPSSPPSTSFEVLAMNKTPNIRQTDYERKLIV